MGEWGVAGPFDELYALVVVVLAMGVFLTSSSVAYLRYAEFSEDLRFQRDALDALDRIAAFPPALRSETPGLLDAGRLSAFDVGSMRDVVGDYDFRILLTDGQGVALVDVATGPTGPRYRLAVATVALWSSPGAVSAARLSLTIWRR